jgi:hypothetical protein
VWHEFGRARLAARTILVAAGTQPNTVLAREESAHFRLDGKYFRLLDEEGRPVTPVKGLAKPKEPAIVTELRADGRATSFFGDLHPSFHGNVVKAMASAKQGYPIVSRLLGKVAPASSLSDIEFLAHLNDEFRATLVRVERLTPTIIEVVVRAPCSGAPLPPWPVLPSPEFRNARPRRRRDPPGNGGSWRSRAHGWMPERGLVSTIVLEMGGSSDLCALLSPGEPVILMGPTGTPTEIAGGETVVLAGGGLGNAVLFSIGQAFRRAGSKVLYFAGYKKAIDRYKIDEIEAAADVVVWCCDEAPGFVATRSQDRTFVGNIVQAMSAYASGALGEQAVPFAAVRSPHRHRL